MSSANSAPILADIPVPYCKGCGHTLIVNAMAKAFEVFEERDGTRENLCLVSDIGCVGLIDKLFPTLHTVHTTHGRSTAMATGISLSDGVLGDAKLKTVVVMGDGGANIGLLHLVAAAQLNVDLTVIIHNNGVFGMTGGQASGLTPQDWTTASTPAGNPIPPLDIVGILRSAGASFIAREVAHDGALAERLVEAIEHPGFSVVEIIELCTAFGVKWNDITGRKLQALAEATGEPCGVRVKRTERLTARQAVARPGKPKAAKEEAELPPATHNLTKPLRVVMAGTAGERVQSAAAMVAEIGVRAGLFATQKNDNLVTQGTGFSLSELILSPEVIHYTGMDVADAVIATSLDGLNRLKVGGDLKRVGPNTVVLVDDTLPYPEGLPCRVLHLPFRKSVGTASAAVAALGWVLQHSGALDTEQIAALAQAKFGPSAKSTIKALEWAATQHG